MKVLKFPTESKISAYWQESERTRRQEPLEGSVAFSIERWFCFEGTNNAVCRVHPSMCVDASELSYGRVDAVGADQESGSETLPARKSQNGPSSFCRRSANGVYFGLAHEFDGGASFQRSQQGSLQVCILNHARHGIYHKVKIAVVPQLWEVGSRDLESCIGETIPDLVLDMSFVSLYTQIPRK